MAINLVAEGLIHSARIPDEIAKITGTRPGRTTIYRWQKEGTGGVRLNCVKIGGRVYTSKPEIRRFLDAAATPTPAA